MIFFHRLALFVFPPHTWQCVLLTVLFNTCVSKQGTIHISDPQGSAHQCEWSFQTMAASERARLAILGSGAQATMDTSGSCYRTALAVALMTHPELAVGL